MNTTWQTWKRRGTVKQLLLATLLAGLTGCGWDRLNWLRPAPPAAPETETFVLRGDGMVEEKAPPAVSDQVAGNMANAREYFRREEYDKAESIYYRVADNDKNAPSMVQEAMYYRAECLRLQGDYSKSADVYSALLGKFPNSVYREQCVQHMYDIANFWLDDTREEMREDRERREGKRTVVWPRFVSFHKSKPLLDREGRAIEKLEQVRLHDINGPLADQALFMCGVIKMYHEDYRDADHYFTQISLRHPDSKLAPRAIELAIFCKHMSTGGSDYDGRKTAEARRLIQVALNNYPELSGKKDKREFLEKQQVSIDLQQAEKDYKMAEFYRRTGHPGSAYFYYQLVRRRYPNTKYARMAEERWNELRGSLDTKELPPESPAPTATTAAPKPTPRRDPDADLGAPAPLPPNPATLPTPTPVPGK
ncbi:MAG: tetratricopeptide repeat protein [Gemmataceae bacterium]